MYKVISNKKEFSDSAEKENNVIYVNDNNVALDIKKLSETAFHVLRNNKGFKFCKFDGDYSFSLYENGNTYEWLYTRPC